MHNKTERMQHAIEVATTHGIEKAAEMLGIKVDTIVRYQKEAKSRNVKIDKAAGISKTLRTIQDIYTNDELLAIARGGRIMPGVAKVPVISFEGRHIKVGHITDTHIGSSYLADQRLYQAFEEFKKEKVDFITHSGDVTEGMSNRPGHVYELSHIGYAKQKKKAIELFGQWTDTDIYAIDGNHDRWYIKGSGAKMVEDIDMALDNFHFIGHDEGDISLKGRATMKLWHGEDGSSYALSYRLQKIIESLSGGEKPNVIVAGHVHKYVKIFERNVYAISVGCLQRQTPWMRGKRLGAHVSFVIADYWVNKEGLAKMSDTLYPFYT